MATPPGTQPTRTPPGTRHPRPRRQLDWELVVCGVRGHVLAGRGVEIPPERAALVICDAGPVSWRRCLRCDSWIALPRSDVPGSELAHTPDPALSLPEPAAPLPELVLPLRGKELRERIVLRLIALDRIAHFLVLGVLGVAVLAFTADRAHLRAGFYRVLTALQGGVAGGPVQTSGHVGILHELDKLFSLRAGTLREVGVALLAYALLEGVEAIGLWFARRWAEYLTFVATTVLLPLEVYEIIHRGTVLKVIGFLINLAVVVYLLLRKRLFGVRGGAEADRAERQHDNGWPALERATIAVPWECAPKAVGS